MCDEMEISAYILKIVKKDPFLRLQMRAKEMFNLIKIEWEGVLRLQNYV